MELGDFNVEASLSQGLSRAQSSFEKEFSLDQLQTLRENLLTTFREYPSDLHERFVGLFTEMAAISEASRIHYGYDSLTKDELSKFLEHGVRFFDSFTHK